MISENNTLIGHVVEINGAEFVAQLISEDEGFVPEVTVDEILGRVGQVGSYLMARQSGLYVLVIVESMWQEIDAEGVLVRMIRLNEETVRTNILQTCYKQLVDYLQFTVEKKLEKWKKLEDL